jgi:hypothetical protein
MRADRNGRGMRQELPTLHRLVLLIAGGLGCTGDANRRYFVVGEAHVSPWDTQAVGDPRQHVIGHDLPTFEDLRHLGLRLASHRRDLAL